jgi:hypothetical protein
MTVVNDILARLQVLATERMNWDRVWSDIADYCLPDLARFQTGTTTTVYRYNIMAQEPSSISRGRVRFDDTALRAIDRLASGMESLVTPQSEKWHGLALTDPFSPEETDEEAEYFERYRDFMFKVRYNPAAGFIGAHQKALRSAIALGTGVVMLEENVGSKADQIPALYRYMPLSECYLSVNAQGEPDTMYRQFVMTARQMIQKFGDRCSDTVKTAAESPTQKDRLFQIVHAVQPREEVGTYANAAKGAPYASFYIDKDHQSLLSESGFFEFPYIVYYWQPVDNLPYAQSPVMMALSEIRGLNSIRKTSLKSLQLFADPAYAVAHDGVMNRPNLNPGKINFGAIDSNGRLKIQPIQTGARPDFITDLIESERKNVNDSLYVTLFQILLQNPQMTATEAMIRANEKGELLGPAGGKIQQAMSREVERLGGILERKGAMAPGAPLAPPETLSGTSFGARFTSPLDRLRRAQEGIGIQRTLELALPMANIDPGVLDNFDTDEIVRTVSEINGAPRKILKTEQERDAARQQRNQMQQTQAALEMAKTGGEAAKNIVPAIGQAQQIAQGNPQGQPRAA